MKGSTHCYLAGLFSKSSQAGFTLIELLVVVLIIGILAGVALPQYQKTVRKTRMMAELIPAMRKLKEAEEIYYLANSSYTSNFENLDITVPIAKDITIRYGWSYFLSNTFLIADIPAGVYGYADNMQILMGLDFVDNGRYKGVISCYGPDKQCKEVYAFLKGR
uniref:Prepilin-type N-terminal cleavage/methylation domain-containing protein n=1 Tax=uncultured Elusimicrobia bacterium TaxID=699876 RepID=A0A650ELU0_9BACT|nr:hypothetical protein Elusimicrob1349_1990 [uncultured Elusimicrobia bacterium]